MLKFLSFWKEATNQIRFVSDKGQAQVSSRSSFQPAISSSSPGRTNFISGEFGPIPSEFQFTNFRFYSRWVFTVLPAAGVNNIYIVGAYGPQQAFISSGNGHPASPPFSVFITRR